MRISDWSSDVCSSDLVDRPKPRGDDWTGYVRVPDDRLGHSDDIAAEDEGGLQQQRHPALDEKPVEVEPATQLELPDMERSEERRGGKECDSTCRSRWSLYH